MKSLSIVLPALNEEEAVAAVVKSIPFSELRGVGYEPIEVLVVDNGSTDDTVERAREAGARVVSEPRRGYGLACRRGFSEACGEHLVLADADGSYSMEDLPALVQPLFDQKADLVLGSRERMEADAMPWLHQRVGNPLLAWLINRLFGFSLMDPQTGFRALKKKHLKRINAGSGGMEYASELIIGAREAGLRITEVPVSYRRRMGRSKLRSLRDGWRHLQLMLIKRLGL